MNQTDGNNDQPASNPPGASGNRGSVAAILAFFALAVIALTVIQMFRAARNLGSNLPAVGHRLPDLRLEPLTGGSSPARPDDLAGKVTLVDFWGTWCPPCRAEFPHLAEMAAEYRDRRDFQLLAVSCGDETDDPESLRPATEAFLQEHKSSVPTYFDPQGYTRMQLRKIGGFEDAYPTTMVLDRQGVIRGIWVGYQRGVEDEIGTLVAKLLSEKPAR